MAKKLTVKDLIAQLADFDEDAVVHIAYNYGDHGRTMVAPAVRVVEDAEVVFSAYHDMDRLADDEERDEPRQVVVLRA